MTTTSLEMIAEACGEPRRNHNGSYNCCCPAHDDQNPSLSLALSEDGKILVHCHAGCTQDQVITEMKDRGLWPGGLSSFSLFINRRKKWNQLSPIPDGVGDPPAEHPTLGKPSQVYTYRDIQGKPLGYVYRFDSPTGAKDIRPLIYAGLDGDEGWKWQGFDKLRPLYGLEQLKGKEPISFIEPANVPPRILIVEGEKTAEAAKALGLSIPVLTWQGGAKAVKHTDWRPLHFYSVVIWPDNDDAGKRAALEIADILKNTSEIRIVDPPAELSEGWDLADAEVSI